MNAQDIERRLQILEDIEEIKKLKYRYCYAVDLFEPVEIIKLFTSSAVADYSEFGKYVGTAEIENFFRKIVNVKMTFLVHMASNPVIDIIDEENATGVWYVDAPGTIDGEARWMCGKYKDEYIKEKGTWKIKSLNFVWFYETPFDKGWVKERIK